MYLLVVMINIANLNPIVVKDCVQVTSEAMRSEAEKASAGLASLGMNCEKNPESISYACQNPKQGLIGKIVVMKDKSDCKSFPQKMSNDMKSLLNRR